MDGSGHLSPVSGSPFPIDPVLGGAKLTPTDFRADPKSRFLLISGVLGCGPNLCLGPLVHALSVIGADHALTYRQVLPNLLTSDAMIDPLGRFLFASDDAGIHTYAIGPDLSLNEVPGSPAGATFNLAAVDPGGRFVVGINNLQQTGPFTFVENGRLAVFEVSPSGALKQDSILQFDSQHLYQVFIHPSGKFLYLSRADVSNRDNPSAARAFFDVFPLDTTGRPIPPANTADVTDAHVQWFAVHPSGNFFYGFQCGSGCFGAAVVAATPDLAAYPIDPATGVVTLTPAFSQPVRLGGEAFDATGQRLFTSSSCSDPVTRSFTNGTLNALSVDVTTGRVTAGDSVTANACFGEIAVTQ